MSSLAIKLPSFSKMTPRNRREYLEIKGLSSNFDSQGALAFIEKSSRATKIIINTLCFSGKIHGYSYPSHTYLAKKAGVARETVCRIISRLKKAGILSYVYRYRRTSVYVLDKIFTDHIFLNRLYSILRPKKVKEQNVTPSIVKVFSTKYYIRALTKRWLDIPPFLKKLKRYLRLNIAGAIKLLAFPEEAILEAVDMYEKRLEYKPFERDYGYWLWKFAYDYCMYEDIALDFNRSNYLSQKLKGDKKNKEDSTKLTNWKAASVQRPLCCVSREFIEEERVLVKTKLENEMKNKKVPIKFKLFASLLF